MLDHDHPHDLEDRLGGHGQFVQRLAAALVGAGPDADDLTQEAWVAVASHTGVTERFDRGTMRAWLGQVMRRRVIGSHRRATTRRSREEQRARSEADVPSPEDLASRKETIAQVSAAVLALEEPYQSTILLVYYDGLSPAEVARRLDAPLATVRSRLQRGKAQLRDALRAHHGDRDERLDRALAPFVLPLAARAQAPSAAAAATSATFFASLLMSIKPAALALPLGLLVWLGLRASSTSAVEPERSPSTMDATPPLAKVDRARDVQPGPSKLPVEPGGRQPAASVTLEAPPDEHREAAPPAPAGVFGRVVFDGRPVPGASVHLNNARIALLTSEGGHKDRTAIARTDLNLAILDKQVGFSTYKPLPVNRAADAPLPPWLHLPGHRLNKGPVITDEEGRFRFNVTPDAPFMLTAIHEGRGLAVRTAPLLGEARPSQDVGDVALLQAASLSGTVRMDHAQRLAGHRLALCGAVELEATIDPDGSFTFPCLPPGEILLSPSTGPGALIALEERHERFLRLSPGEARRADLEIPTLRCTVVSVSVTSGGEPVTAASVAFRSPDGRSRYGTLDEAGRATLTVPAHAPLRCVLHAAKNESTLAAELRFDPGETSLDFETGQGRAILHVPTDQLPSLPVAWVTFTTNDSRIDEVCFDSAFGLEGRAVPLDQAGRATMDLLAWFPLEPRIHLEGSHWVHLDTDKADFPAGAVSFDLQLDESTGSYSLETSTADYSVNRRPGHQRRRLALRWVSDATGEPVSEAKLLNHLHLVTDAGPRYAFEFSSLPPGTRDFTASLQVNGRGEWKDTKTWPLSLTIVPGATAEVTLPEESR